MSETYISSHDGDFHIIPFREPASFSDTLTIALDGLSPEERDTRVRNLQEQYEKGNLSPQGIFLAVRSDSPSENRMIGAVFSQSREDGTVLIWPPASISGNAETDDAVRTALFAAVEEHVRAIQARIAILFMESGVGIAIREIERAGFTFLSEMLFLAADERIFPMEPPARNPLSFVPLRQSENSEGDTDSAFRNMVALVDRTYEETKDFPELCGISPTEEIVRGYQFEGVFRPELWFTVSDTTGNEVGCLILTDHADGEQMELTYMGLTPQARGKGYARSIVQFALGIARKTGRRLLTVSVDAQNEPALKTYQKCGFQIWDRKKMYVRFF